MRDVYDLLGALVGGASVALEAALGLSVGGAFMIAMLVAAGVTLVGCLALLWRFLS